MLWVPRLSYSRRLQFLEILTHSGCYHSHVSQSLTISAAFAGVSQALTVTELVTAATGLCPVLPAVITENASTLLTILGAVGDEEIIPGAPPSFEGQTISIFAPSDDAFADLLENTLDGAELGEIPPQTVVDILKLHIVLAPTANTTSFTALDGETVTLDGDVLEAGPYGSAAVLAGPIPESCAGVINVYSIDSVLIPKAVAEALAAAPSPAMAPAEDDVATPPVPVTAVPPMPVTAVPPTSTPAPGPESAPAPAPAPTDAASSVSFGVAAILAGVVALFA
jgi:uncharacterized surface protein with fasciclin (FAS1) repeats